jgi:hypothetical protein
MHLQKRQHFHERDFDVSELGRLPIVEDDFDKEEGRRNRKGKGILLCKFFSRKLLLIYNLPWPKSVYMQRCLTLGHLFISNEKANITVGADLPCVGVLPNPFTTATISSRTESCHYS